MSTAFACIPTLLSFTTTYCTVPVMFCLLPVSGLCVTLCRLFSSFSPVPSYNFCHLSVSILLLLFPLLCYSSTLHPSLQPFSLFLLFLSFSGCELFFLFCLPTVLLRFLSSFTPSLALSSFLPSFSPSPWPSFCNRVSQSPWWCALCTLPPLTVLPPSCVNMPVIWAALPCAESRVGGWKETEPT